MRLLIDQGNSYTKYAVVTNNSFSATEQIATNKLASSETIFNTLSKWMKNDIANQIALCTVVPALLPAWISAAAQFNTELNIITGETATGMQNLYQTPATLGADRLMAALAARELAGSPVICLNLGTATVADAISADGCYLGGMISPGIASCRDALFAATSALPTVVWQPPSSPIGRDTLASLHNGIFYHSIGGIKALLAVLYNELGADTPLVLTGGWADVIAPHLPYLALIEPQLVLRGMAITMKWLNKP